MEKIINNPGLQHLVEKVFFNIYLVEDLEICAQINQSWKQILENPIFWLHNLYKGVEPVATKNWYLHAISLGVMHKPCAQPWGEGVSEMSTLLIKPI